MIHMTVRLVHNDSSHEDLEILVPEGKRGLTLPPEVLLRSERAFVLDPAIQSPVETCECKLRPTVHYLYREHSVLVVK